MELNDAIYKRRSVRKFSSHYVTNNELRDILDAARYAPSWGNTQCWEFVIVRDREIINEITETYIGTNPAKKCSFDVSALIIACAVTNQSGYKKKEKVTKFNEWFMFDLGLAVQNLCLKAHELGLGTVIVGLIDHDACKKVLSIPEDYEAVVSIPIGKPEGDPRPAPGRKELKEFVRIDTFPEFFTSIDSQE